MISIKQTIVVEGIYDKIKLESIVSSPIITTSGFSIFKEREKQELLKKIARKTGIVILTDSDHAGFQIRNFLADILPEGSYKHVYIPEIEGKEKRKCKPSAEGLLGVEGVSASVLKNAFSKAGLLCDTTPHQPQIDTACLFELGLNGGQGSKARRAALLRELELPAAMSAKQLLSVLNILLTKAELESLVQKLNAEKREEL